MFALKTQVFRLEHHSGDSPAPGTSHARGLSLAYRQHAGSASRRRPIKLARVEWEDHAQLSPIPDAGGLGEDALMVDDMKTARFA